MVCADVPPLTVTSPITKRPFFQILILCGLCSDLAVSLTPKTKHNRLIPIAFKV